MRVVVHLCAGILMLAGCQSLETIEPDLCGNRVVEPAVGEECDTFDTGGRCGRPESRNACRYVCVDDGGDYPCPPGWQCGVDGRCRRPVREFTSPPRIWPLSADVLVTGDVDGDGFADLIGDSDDMVSVRFADLGGALDELFRIQVPDATDALAYGSVDRDGRMDVVVPLDVGLYALLGRSDRVFGPVAYAKRDLSAVAPARLVPLESDRRAPGTEVLTFSGTTMRFQSLTGADQGPAVALPAPGRTVEDILGRIPTVDLDGNRRLEFALPIQGSRRIWIYTSTGTVANGTLQVTLTATVGLSGEVRRGARFADLNGDGRLDLLVSVSDVVRPDRLIVAYFNAQRGRFDEPCPVDLVNSSDGSVIPWPLAFGDVDGNRRADLVTPAGVYTNDSRDSTPRCNEVSYSRKWNVRGDPWTEAVVGDFNGDGTLDVAGASATPPRVTFLLGSGGGGFTDFVRRTRGPATLLRVADYDGDFVSDLALTARNAAGEEDDVVVAFGRASGGPSELVSMGPLGTIVSVEPLDAVPGESADDRATDLLVVSQFLGVQTSATVLFGSSERRMVAPLVLARDNGTLDTPVGVAVGNFCQECPTGIDCPERRSDVAAIGTRGVPTERNVWILPGRAGGAPAALAVSESTVSRLPAFEDFDARCAIWLAGDLDGDGFDELIGIDEIERCAGAAAPRPGRLLVARPERPDTRCDSRLEVRVSSLPSSLLRVTGAHLARVDGDEGLDLILSFGGVRDGDRTTGAGIAVLFNNDGRLTTDSVATIARRLPVHRVLPIVIDDDPGPELVFITASRLSNGQPGEGIFTVNLVPGTRGLDQPVPLLDVQSNFQLGVADFNADGLHDIAFSDGELVKVIYAVPDPAPVVKVSP